VVAGGEVCVEVPVDEGALVEGVVKAL